MQTMVRKVRAFRRRAELRYQQVIPASRRAARNPFRPGHDVPLLIHCTYHKCGTVWFQNVLRAVSAYYGMAYEQTEGDVGRDSRVVVHMNSEVDLATLPPLRGSHMIRDPRDVVVSAYFFHLWSDEPWLHQPRADLGGSTYQAHLRSLSRDEGLMAEMRETAPTVRKMLAWNYDDARFLELRYEDAIVDDAAMFEQLFAHHGFHEAAIERCRRIAARFSFERMTGRKLGEVREHDHFRSGRPGQWRDVLTDDHVAYFDEITDDGARRLGYPGR